MKFLCVPCSRAIKQIRIRKFSVISATRRALVSLGFWPTVATPAQPTILPSDVPIEEELLPGYDPQNYYPVNPGDVFHNRYEMMAKLGFGSCSTVWLARDMHRYVLSPSDPTSFILLQAELAIQPLRGCEDQ